jgi:hypothetical protein
MSFALTFLGNNADADTDNTDSFNFQLSIFNFQFTECGLQAV